MKNVYCIVEDKKDRNKRFWRQVGVAFENRDGSLNVQLHMFPDLDLQIRDREPASDGQPATNNGAAEQRNDRRGGYRR